MTIPPAPYNGSEVLNVEAIHPAHKKAFRLFLFSIIYILLCAVTFFLSAALEEAGITRNVLTLIYSLVFNAFVGIPVGVTLIVKTHKSLRQIKNQKTTGKGYAITALVLGYLIGLVGILSFGYVALGFMILNGVI